MRPYRKFRARPTGERGLPATLAALLGGTPRAVLTVVALLACLSLPEDSLAQSVIATIPVGGAPTGVATNPTTNQIYVANNRSGMVSVIDGATNTVTATVPIMDPAGVATNPATNRIYVTDPLNGTMSVIDGQTNAIVAVIPLGRLPFSIAVAPTTNRIYVAIEGDRNVAVIDGATNVIVATIPVTGHPLGVAVNQKANRVYALHQAEQLVGEELVVIDATTNSVVTTVPLPRFTTPTAVAVDESRNRIYVSGVERLVVIDGTANAVVATLSLPGILGATRDNVAVNSLTNRIYMTDFSFGHVVVVDGASNTVAATLTLGGNPHSVAVTPARRRVYVTNSSQDAVVVIQDGRSVVPFAAFSVKVEINVSSGEFEMEGTFILGAESDGIDPLTEDVDVQVGTFSTTIPSGSFTQDRKGRFKFGGAIDGVALEAVIVPLTANTFRFRVSGEGANLPALQNPVIVGLAIGDDGGSAMVTAEFRKKSHSSTDVANRR